MSRKPSVTPNQRKKLEAVFGEEGTRIIVSHLDDFEETFGSAAVVIRKIMEEPEDD